MRKYGKRIGWGWFSALVLAVCLSVTGMEVWAAASGGGKTEGSFTSEKTAEGYTEVHSEWVDLGETMTSAPRMFRSMSGGGVALKDGNYVDWIDRIEVPAYARELYDKLVEASDNDGTDDWLIDVTKGEKNSKEDYVITVTDFEGQAADAEAIAQAVNEKLSEISMYIRAVFDAFDRDHPEVFWLSGGSNVSVSYSYWDNGEYKAKAYFALKINSSGSFDIRAGEYQDANKVRADIQERDTQVETITGTVSGAGTVECLCGLNQWLTKNNGYNTSGSGNFPASAHECLCALKGSRNAAGPVCEGYARAFKVLCDKIGIPCTLVDGEASNSSGRSEGHMWNYVQVGAEWYGVDVTWNDPVTSSGDTEGNENYFLAGSDTLINGKKFIESHPVSNTASDNGTAFTNGPKLSSSKFDAAVGQVAIGNCQIKITPDRFTYDGTEKIPAVQVVYNVVLVENRDYTVSCANNREAGTASVTITGKGNFTDKVTRTFTIEKSGQNVEASVIPAAIQVGQTGKITVKGIGNISLRSNDPAIATVDNAGVVTGVAAGTAKITVTAAGNRNVKSGVTTISVTVVATSSGEEKPSGDNTRPTVPARGIKLTDRKTKNVYKVTKAGSTAAYAGTANKKATSVKIPATVKLDGVTYKVTSIADQAFKNNKKLKTVTIGGNVASIGSSAFQNCTALTKITIPAKVTKIGGKAFYGCKKLTSIIIKSQKLTAKNVGSKAFTKTGSSNYKKTRVTVPKKKNTSYKKILKAKGLSAKAKVVKGK